MYILAAAFAVAGVKILSFFIIIRYVSLSDCKAAALCTSGANALAEMVTVGLIYSARDLYLMSNPQAGECCH